MADLVSVTEAAQSSIYSHEHITFLVRKGKISGRKTGGVWLVDVKSIKEYERKMQELGPHKHNPVKK